MQGSGVGEVGCELLRYAGTKLFNRCVGFYLLDFKILLLVVLGSKSLPWKRSFQKVDKNVASRLQIVSPALFNTDMSVDRRISRRSS
jgi:hypothetical protein